MTQKEKADYIARFGDQSNVVRLCFSPSQTIGIGVEYVVLDDRSLFKLIDGRGENAPELQDEPTVA